MLRVTAAATSTALFTASELRLAIGLSAEDASQDAILAPLGLAAAAAIAAECGVAGDGSHAPTLLRETLVETFRPARGQAALVLARRFVSSVATIVEDGLTLSVDDFEVDAEAGLLMRLCHDAAATWLPRPIIVTYDAGFASVPGDLKAAAAALVRSTWFEGRRDPLAKSESVEIPGVMTRRQDFWVGGLPASGPPGPVPERIAGMLTRFRNGTVF